MSSEEQFFTFFFLLVLVLAAGAMLRILSSAVQQYATQRGSPRLALGVRVVGAIFLVPGILFGLFGVVYLVEHHDDQTDFQVALSLFLAAGYLILAAIFALWWGRQIGSAERTESTEIGARYAHGLLYVAGVVSLMLCIMNSVGSVVARLFIPVLTTGLILVVLIDVLLTTVSGLHQRFLSLWQIYLAVRSRRPLADEIERLALDSWGRRRRRLKDMCEELQEGVDPQEVFDHAALVSTLEGAQLATGLKTGRLPQVLNEILRRRTEFAKELPQVQNPVIAILYLWLVVVVMYSVVGFISYWITPKFKKIFDDFGTELPRATIWVTRLSDAFANVWILGVPMVLLVLAALTGLALVPLAGGVSGLRSRLAWWWPRICLPDVLRALSLAAQANVPLEEAFVPFVRRQLRIPLHNRLVRAQEVIRDGGDCWIALADEKLLKPPEAQFLRSAQRAGNLPWALETLSTRFEQQWQFWLMFCFEFVQPALVLAIGLVVAFVAVAYFLPLVKLINDLS